MNRLSILKKLAASEETNKPTKPFKPWPKKGVAAYMMADAFNPYFIMEPQELTKSPHYKTLDTGASIGRYTLLASILSNLGLNFGLEKLEEKSKRPYSKDSEGFRTLSDEAKKLEKSMGVKDIKYRFNSSGGYFEPKNRIINTGGSLPIFAHELGHAKQEELTGKYVGKKVQKALEHQSNLYRRLVKGSPILRMAFFPPLSVVSGVSAAYGEPKKGKINKGALPGYAISAAGLPILGQEASASYHAVKHLYKTRGAKEAIKGLGHLGPAFGTYLSLIAAPGVASYIVSKHLKNKKRVK